MLLVTAICRSVVKYVSFLSGISFNLIYFGLSIQFKSTFRNASHNPDWLIWQSNSAICFENNFIVLNGKKIVRFRFNNFCEKRVLLRDFLWIYAEIMSPKNGSRSSRLKKRFNKYFFSRFSDAPNPSNDAKNGSVIDEACAKCLNKKI